MTFRNSTLTAFVVALLVAVASQSALARRIIDPPWLVNPSHYPLGGGTTTVEWEFDQDLNDPIVHQTNYGPTPPPQISWPDHTPQDVPGPDGTPIQTWHIDQDGWIEIFLHNDPIPHQFKDILLQITSDKAPAFPPGPEAEAPGTPPTPGTPGPVAAWGPSAGGDFWYTYTYTWTIQPNPPYEWIRIPVIFSTNIEEIVIDTISYDVPEPAMLGVLAIGIVLMRRRG